MEPDFSFSFSGGQQPNGKMRKVFGTPICIDERFLMFWDGGSELQLAYLDSIDVQYFHYQALANFPFLATDGHESAATALRFAYSHALETLFALIGAAIQAPHCPAGWMLLYRGNDVSSV